MRYRRDLTGIDTLYLPVFDTAILSARFRFLQRKKRLQSSLTLQIPKSPPDDAEPRFSSAQHLSLLSHGSSDGSTPSDLPSPEATEAYVELDEHTRKQRKRQSERDFYIDILQHSGDLGYRDYLGDYTRRANPSLYNISTRKRRERRIPTPDIARRIPSHKSQILEQFSPSHERPSLENAPVRSSTLSRGLRLGIWEASDEFGLVVRSLLWLLGIRFVLVALWWTVEKVEEVIIWWFGTDY